VVFGPKLYGHHADPDYRGTDDRGDTVLKLGTKINIGLARNLRTIQRTPFATLPWSKFRPETLTAIQGVPSNSRSRNIHLQPPLLFIPSQVTEV
jgi:hypothetical protein